MADLLLQPLIKIVMQKAMNSLEQQIVEIWGVDDQRVRLHDRLLAIQAVLTDAEDQAASNPAVKNWMLKLKSAAYDADDVLDEFCYEELHRDAVKRGHKVGNTVSGFFSLNNPALFRYKMSRKLRKVVGRIEELVAEMQKFKFVQCQRVQVVNRVGTDSVLVESKVVGRDEDKETIVKLLLEGCEGADLMVVPVVGMGGLGKTTLAQLVYNDPRVKEHFKLPIWVCVSEEFNINVLVKSIIDLVIHGDCKLPIDNMELLQRRLRGELSGKRYLLVLDDVWNDKEDDWERLRAALNYGDSGSAVIVTTRSSIVGSIMGTVKSYNLECLSETDSWSLFHKRAFSKGVKECQELVDIGRKMVQNCGGLPLAIRTLSSLMSYKHEVPEWLAVLEESKIWKQEPAKNEVLSVLRLSYDHLPLFMKQCFAFCAIFPKDHVMDKDKLIQLWIANGFIPIDGPGSLEMKGNDIFKELAWRSFFQDVEQVRYFSENSTFNVKDGHCHLTTCKMHDLMHDLAESITRGECASTLEVPKQHNQPMLNVRHIFLKTTPLDINNVMNFFPSIRSLMFCPSSDSDYVRNLGFLKSNALRILKLELAERTTVTPEKMKHLRYLEISLEGHTSLPEAISTLYLLQTLRLSNCWDLEKLPEGMQYMSSLRHLYIDRCDNLRSMPSGLGQLSCLQTLTTYIIGVDARNSIAELGNLNLYGKLHIYNLREIRDVTDARDANLRTKQNLDDLLFCWGTPNDYENVKYGEAESNPLGVMHCDPLEVLDALKPCNKLKVLGVALYGSDKFPVWMTEFQMLENLVELYITECRECTKIPAVEKLPFLQILKLRHLDKMRHLCNSASTSDQGSEDDQIVFPSLERLQLSEMPNLCSWFEGEAGNETSLAFPLLKELDITNCPKLIAMPTIPLVENLTVEGNKTLSRFATRLTTLQELSLGSHGREVEHESESLSFQPWESLEHLLLTGYSSIVPMGAHEEEVGVIATKCRRLSLTSCNFFSSQIPSNSSLWFWKCFTFLEDLYLGECDTLIYWPVEVFRSLNCLAIVGVSGCPNFLGSQRESPVERSNTEVLLPKLRYIFFDLCPNLIEIPKCQASIQAFCIYGCSKLQYLPEWLGTMVALKQLKIRECESLNSLPSNIEGLSNLEIVEIFGCPNLGHLPEGMEGLNALQEFKITKCPKIRVLPDGLLQQLKNLDKLLIEGCPQLERHFRKYGKYQHLVSEIRIRKIGDERRSGILRDLVMSVPSCKITCFSARS